MDTIMNLSSRTKLALTAIVAVLGVGLFVVLAVYGFINGTRNDGVTKEAALTAQYLDNQNELSSYISKVYETIGVANLKSDRFDRVLSDAIKGRYDGTGIVPQPLGQSSQFISALVEAYPDLAGLNIYDKIIDIVSAGREAYKQKQSKLLDMLRDYDTWRETGIFKSMVVRMLGFPSDRLEARVGETTLRGNDARNKMYQIVLASDAIKAYETGVMEPLQIPTAPR